MPGIWNPSAGYHYKTDSIVKKRKRNQDLYFQSPLMPEAICALHVRSTSWYHLLGKCNCSLFFLLYKVDTNFTISSGNQCQNRDYILFSPLLIYHSVVNKISDEDFIIYHCSSPLENEWELRERKLSHWSQIFILPWRICLAILGLLI